MTGNDVVGIVISSNKETPDDKPFSMANFVIDASWGKAVFHTDTDLMHLFMTSLNLQSVDTGLLSDIIEKLREKGIVFGIKEDVLTKIFIIAGKSKKWQGKEVVACGVAAQDVVDWDFPILNGATDFESEEGFWRVGETVFDFQLLNEMLCAKQFEEETLTNVNVLAVEAGSIIARARDLNSKLGTNIQGDIIYPNGQKSFQAGSGVDIALGGYLMIAKHYGYLLVQDNELSVVSPMVVSEDWIYSYFLNCPQPFVKQTPDEKTLAFLLRQQGVSIDLDADLLKDVCERLTASCQQTVWLKTAQGKGAVDGQSAQVAYNIDFKGLPGEVRSDGSIDLNLEHIPSQVQSGDLILEKVEPTEGSPGLSLDGRCIDAKNGKDEEIIAGNGIEVGQQEGVLRFVAKDEGIVRQIGNKLEVSAILSFKGDVGSNEGDIESDSDIYVGGWVRSGASLNSKGNIIVAKGVEPGVAMQANGHVTIGQGISGDGTTLIVGGDLRTHSIQDAQVSVVGDIWVGSFVQNARIKCGGFIKVCASDDSRGGSIVGGEVVAVRGMEFEQAGGTSQNKTALVIRHNMPHQKKLEELNKQIVFCEENVAKMMRTLKITNLHPETIKQSLLKMPTHKRRLYVEIAKKMGKLVVHRSEANKQKLDYEELSDREMESCVVRVNRIAFPGVALKFKNVEWVLEKEVTATTFRLKNGEITAT